VRNVLGRPDLGRWEVFFRESVQNSWDARLNNKIRFSVSGVHLSPTAIKRFRTHVFHDLPHDGVLFDSWFDSEAPAMIVVTDTGTKGLGGITRADREIPAGSSSDFVDFVLNIGRSKSKVVGGGTYGFGKGVLYEASRLRTCGIYTQVFEKGVFENRLIFAAVRDSFSGTDGKNYSGRHWWGDLSGETLEPWTGSAARELAVALGIAGMNADQTGTSIAVLDPLVRSDGGLLEAIQAVRDACVEWAWPHFVDLSGAPSIDFEFRIDDVPLALPNLASDPLSKSFFESYELAVKVLESESEDLPWPWSAVLIRSQKPSKLMGALVYRSHFTGEAAFGPAKSRTHHIALMRNPHFVVKYLEVLPDPAGHPLIGVFLAAGNADLDFARSEPVAHDDWKPEYMELERGARNPVKIALRGILAAFRESTSQVVQPVRAGQESGVAQLSRLLGRYLTGVTGNGAESVQFPPGPERPSGGSAIGRPKVSIAPNTALTLQGDQVLAEFFMDIAWPRRIVDDFTLEAIPRVVLDGGASEKPNEAPAHADLPELYEWRVDGLRISTSPVVSASLFRGGLGSVVVVQPSGAAVTLEIRVGDHG
jgi:hypothetical protein